MLYWRLHPFTTSRFKECNGKSPLFLAGSHHDVHGDWIDVLLSIKNQSECNDVVEYLRRLVYISQEGVVELRDGSLLGCAKKLIRVWNMFFSLPLLALPPCGGDGRGEKKISFNKIGKISLPAWTQNVPVCVHRTGRCFIEKPFPCLFLNSCLGTQWQRNGVSRPFTIPNRSL